MDINPAEYIVLRDTREQLPYDLSPFQMREQGLKTGDYSIAGFEDQICIERKSLDDFISSITYGRDRFEREIERMKPIPSRMILIEGSALQISQQRYFSKTKPQSIMGTIAKYMSMGIGVFLAGDREVAQDFARRFLYQSVRQRKQLQPVAESATSSESNPKAPQVDSVGS